MTRRPFILGLTGSIGMGKSTTAGFFTECGIPVWDADSAVHRLYAKSGAAVGAVAGIWPKAVIDDVVDRAALREWISTDNSAIKKLEAVIHPLVAQDRQTFILAAQNRNEWLVVVDVPLLFETGGDAYVDAILVVTAPTDVQKARVLARENMDVSLFAKITEAQMPDAEKRKRADYTIETTSLDVAKADVVNLISELKQKVNDHA
ncbi:MAG: dephospho-CoA kinase [Paracoccaceae bacterium]|jgi:dephospho-CoA kinase